MTRFSAAAAIWIFLSIFIPSAGTAQSHKTAENNTCEGGSLRNGQCICPAGFNPRQAGDNPGSICVKTHAENCLGGELTVAGRCLCNSQVVMSGETYLLEYVHGKCVPKRCPVQTRLEDGKCVATSDTSPATGPEPAGIGKPAPPKQDASEEAESRRSCGRGMVRTRSGCVPVHRRYPRYHD